MLLNGRWTKLSFRHVVLSNLLLSSTTLFLSYDISRDIAVKSPTGFKRYSRIHRVEFIYLSIYIISPQLAINIEAFAIRYQRVYLSAINYFRIMQKSSIREYYSHLMLVYGSLTFLDSTKVQMLGQ